MNANWRNKAIGGLLAITLLMGCDRGTENKESTAPANPNVAGHEGHGHTTAEAAYTCPMHPQIVQDEPGSCPICGMDLVKKASMGGDSLAVDAELKALLKPTNAVVVANIGTVQPQQRSQTIQTQANGIVTYDTRRLYTIPARFGGRVEKLYVRYQYQSIRKGQKLLELYSPDMVTAQRELLYVLEADADNAQLITSAKQKLRLLGVTDEQIKELVRTRKPSYSLAVYSPYDGYVVETSAVAPVAQSPATGEMTPSAASGGGMSGGMGGGGASATTDEVTFGPRSASMPTPTMGDGSVGGSLLLREGQYVQSGQTLFRIVNSSRLWAEFRLYARDAAGIKPGDALTISFDQTGQTPRSARVSFVVPFIEGNGQFVTIRAYLPGSRDIRVGQLVRATLRRPGVNGLWLPASAVLDLGNQQVALVQQQAPNTFLPVRVQTGAQADGYVVITGGLSPGQTVARNAQFLIDSESFVNVSNAKQQP
ncbi:RND family efflux transporter MFP subunit (plasmid) [Fibrisoma limi BUZ 3]|uniref:RND family efflux transporter MFP subunit n=1 Tax=Fibrisoma limi BUZ 3 TaxID=1185876 RepID=I2GU54_9BACT|nr:efflux RND transporter periplasmic adaptor subunit [Fibrisoma limi]CCH57655.1 RND family efflux transporter MFP subunit [Fibrisoma limi BUZ 3]